MRRNYQHVLYSGIEYVSNGDGTTTPQSTNPSIPANYIGPGSNGIYLRVISLGTSPSTNNTALRNMAQTGSWRTVNGVIYSNQSTLTIQVGDVFISNGTAGPNNGTTVALCGKRYLPSVHVLDIYLKNGSRKRNMIF